jgi:hypothetical protein
MNDYWNDPPDEDRVYPAWAEPDEFVYYAEEAYGLPAFPKLCPHGNTWGECDRCDYGGDIAYDANRERR